jgi:copper transport protein
MATVVVALAALVGASTASAHATLVSTTPPTDAVLKASPKQVLLHFSESVETALGSLRVYDGAARRVDDGNTTRPASDEVAVGLRSNLPKGTYTVAWRVISADSHPVHGAFVFHVGKPGVNAAGVAAQVLEEQAGSRTVDVAFGVVRFLTFATILLFAGGAIVLALVLGAGAWRPIWWTLAGAGLLLALASLAGIGLEGAKAAGFGLGSAFRPSLFRDVLDTNFGRVSIARTGIALVAAALAAVGLRRELRWRRELTWAAVVLGAALALTPALAGHARVDGAFAVAVDWTHVLAAAAWTGGLACVLLALATSRGQRWPLAGRIVPRFSTLAVVSVAALIVAGVVNGYLEVQHWSGLWDTTYGQLLLVKVALVLPLLALGAFNNRISVPRLRSGLASALDRRRFALATGVELSVVVVIVAVTAALVAEPPAKAQLAARAGPVSREAVVGPFDLNLVVDPARTGTNEIHLYLLSRSTGEQAAVDEVRVAASLPAAGIGPLRMKALPAGPGHVIVSDASFPLVGDWRLRVDVRRGEFDEWSTTVTVPIRKGTP